MLSAKNEISLARYLSFGAPAISILVLWGVVTDPVNATKHFLLGSIAFASFSVAALFGYKLIWRESKLTLLACFAFLVASISAVANSTGPAAQNLYGSYGRNTGFITYLMLILVLISGLSIRNRKNFELIVKGLLTAGLVNILYSLWAWQIGDFIGWNNPYKTILGTFGNPNFIGAFLGIIVSVLFAFAVKPDTSLKLRLSAAFFILIGLLEIRQSHAIQGVVVAAGGFALVMFFFLRSKFNSNFILIAYSSSVLVTGAFAILGALQKGPLTQYIYKTSVSLRGEYWQAGINMAKERPLTGVGMDTYGDWYRRAREESAIILPGPNVVTNAAHNVNLDLIAFGGWPLFLSYIFLLVIGAFSILKVLLRSREYDWVFVSISVAWICYQVQALISINQIGLAVWGWLLTGLVIAYECATRNLDGVKSNDAIKGSAKNNLSSGYSGRNLSPQLIGSLGLVFGGLLAVPPLSADMSWRSALQSQNVEKVEISLQPSYLTPPNTAKYAQAVQLFESSNLPDLAYKYAKIAVEFNPDAFDAWKLLYYISKSTQSDKDQALQNMKRLDPLHPNVLDRPQ